ncbi:MAG: type IV secretory system conjugative DNA transfer family protein [Clostridia bacterium]|nr:type IV secretory system conjugative DNA transfer family protein [Clostridia bacterium]
MGRSQKTLGIAFIVILGLIALMYLSGLLGQLIENYSLWLESGGISGGNSMPPVQWNLIKCFRQSFTAYGLKAMVIILGLGGGIFAYIKLHDKFDGKEYDPRGFAKSKTGAYGTASWMTEKEMKDVLEVASPAKAEGIILGEYKGNVICLPKDTRLNRHIAIFGASGTMKSRAIIRNALFQAIKRNESVVITDPKGELYSDTAELFKENGYEVKVFNLVHPEHSDSWNCMSDLHGDTLLAQDLTNVIIGNTSSGKGDHFWDNGEANLLKALVLYVDFDAARTGDMKNLPAVYQLLTQYSERQLTSMFEKLPMDHPARAPFNLFAQASDTVRSGIIIGLGTRLQVLQNKSVAAITSRSDIDLTSPGKHKCAYFIILSDQNTTMAFLSSLFFSFLFTKLTRYADLLPQQKCEVPVNMILDEFNNIGKIGSAADGSDFARTLSVIRSRDIKVMMAVQSLGQLQNRYPNNLWLEILGNADLQLMLGCSDSETASFYSERAGDMSIQINTTMTVRQTMAVAQVIPQYRHTEGQGRRKLLTPDEVLRLPNEELLCVIRGQNVLKLGKFDYTKHPMSKMIKRVSIMDYNPSSFYHTDFYKVPDSVEASPAELAEPAKNENNPGNTRPDSRRKLYSSLAPPDEF